MGRFLIGIAVGVAVTLLAIVIIGFAVARFFENKKPVIASDSALVLPLEGDVPEAAPVQIPLPFIESKEMPDVRDVWASLRDAATDPRIKCVVVKPHALDTGWGKLQELRQEILQFRKSGKPVYAYVEGAGSREYYIASAAEKIYISPDDMLDVKGFRVGSMYFKNALDKLGVSVQVDHMGRYKDAGDTFTRSDMSPETREVLGQVLDQVYNDFCTTAGQGRRKSADEMRAIVDQGPFLADAARAAGLVDAIGYEDEMYSELKKRTGVNEIKKLDIRTYARALSPHGDKIAMIVAQGEIVRGDLQNSSGASTVSSIGFSKLIRQVRDDSSIKGVILRVDSPGGDAVASDEILHQMKLLAKAKPLIISFSDLAASGGYFISMTGTPIVSYPDTLTGSIGVLYIRPSFHSLFDKLGIQEDEITRGKLADLDSLYNPLSDAAKQKLHDAIANTYHTFVSDVAQARRKTYDQVEPLAQGRVWMGQQARDNGLVDELGGLDRAVALIRERAKLSTSGDTDLVMYPPKRSLLDVLTSSSSPESAVDALAERKIRSLLPFRDISQLPALRGGGIERLLPYRITVQ